MRLLLSFVLLVFFSVTLFAQEPFDIVIKNGRIVDGTGAPWYIADVGVSKGKIAKIGRIDETKGKRVIDAEGLIVAPGFIDMMGQTATPMMDDPATSLNLLTQGITTINAGEGMSAAPLGDEDAAQNGWRTMEEYFHLLDQRGLPVNVVQTVGHTQVRRIVIGDTDRRPSDEELSQMKALVAEGMEAGAIGVSTALIYPPAVYASTEEIGALVEEAGKHGGRYYTHMRNEGDLLLEAIDEALEIGEAGDAPVHIFHLKAAGRQNWGKMQLAIAKIKAARAEGRQVAADIYPYVNNGLGVAAFIHPRHFENGRSQFLSKLKEQNYRDEIQKEMETTGGWENWYRHVGHDWGMVVIGETPHPDYNKLAGQSLADIAAASGEGAWEVFFKLVESGAFALPQSMTDANKIMAMQQEFISFCTDVGPSGGSRISSHPRAYGSFPRLLSRYVRDLGAISLEQAVSRASASAANEIMARDRGRIAEGLAADVIVFDYENLTDKATFDKPRELSQGMKYVLVNGKLVLNNGLYTGKRPGRVLRGPGYKRENAPVNVSSGKKVGAMKSFDDMMRNFVEHHELPGAAIAVTDQSRLVFARGYGYADIAAKEPVTPASLFRIASISKPITAVAILQLVEQEKIKLDDNVFDILNYDPHLPDDAEFDERQKNITIRQLLQHRGGWDREASFDAMFQSVQFAELLQTPAPAGPLEVIRVMLGNKLDFDPGERYAYSNYGYCLLGRVIEKVTDQSYEDYVKKHVLKPIGVTTMRIGCTREDGRCENEVRYYHPGHGTSVFADSLGQSVPPQYGGWHLEAMDSHGGWIGSVTDLARFATAFDDPENCELLKPETIAEMYARPAGLAGYEEDGSPKDFYYSCGWMNRYAGDKAKGDKHNRWHTGSLPGTAAILIRRHDGKNLIALFNSRVSPHAEHLGRTIDPLLHQAAGKVKNWDVENLFEE